MKAIITRSALLHLRFAFSFFLLPVFIFALSETGEINLFKTLLIFIIWHFLVYPASNGYNSYFDKDEGSIALLESPPAVDKSLYYTSLLLDSLAFILSLFVSFEFALAVLIYGMLSKLYSHPATRLKKYPIISFLVVFVFQGAFVYWASFSAISGSTIGEDWNANFFLGGLICSCLIGASYPLTQVYQHEEDAKRGDKTLSLILGIKGSFVFSGLLFFAGTFLVWYYWKDKNTLFFYAFLFFIIPVLVKFGNLAHAVWKKGVKPGFREVMQLTTLSGGLMLLYFLFVLILRRFMS